MARPGVCKVHFAKGTLGEVAAVCIMGAPIHPLPPTFWAMGVQGGGLAGGGGGGVPQTTAGKRCF